MTQEQLSIDSHNFSSRQLKQPPPVYTDSGQGVQPNPFPAPHKFPTSAAYRRHTEGRRGLEVALKKLAQKNLIGKRSVEEFLLDQYRRGCRPHMFPKRVGVPKIIASADASSSTVQTGICEKAF